MEQTDFPIFRNLPLERLVTDALGEIERLGYSSRSRNRYRAIWEHLVEFSDRKELGDEFSGHLAVRFLEEYRAGDEEMDTPGEGWRRHIVWGVKVLADFAKNGRIERAFTEVEAIHLVPAMRNTLRDYEQYCKDRLHLRPATLHGRSQELTVFLDFVHSRKARTLDQIQAMDLSEFVSCRDHVQPKTTARIVSDVRSFLRFLTMRGILRKDLSAGPHTLRHNTETSITLRSIETGGIYRWILRLLAANAQCYRHSVPVSAGALGLLHAHRLLRNSRSRSELRAPSASWICWPIILMTYRSLILRCAGNPSSYPSDSLLSKSQCYVSSGVRSRACVSTTGTPGTPSDGVCSASTARRES